MTINLNLLLDYSHKLHDSDKRNLIVLEYCGDNELRCSKGNVVVFYKYSRFMEILEVNEVNLKNEVEVYQTLAKHILNQLSAAIGKKVFPEIKSIQGDHI